MALWLRYRNKLQVDIAIHLTLQVRFRKLICAGKKLHEILVEAGNDGVDGVVRKYLHAGVPWPARDVILLAS